MTTNSATTQIDWDEFRQKCAELEKECLDSKAKSSSLSTKFEDLEKLSAKFDHIDDGIMDGCYSLAAYCSDLCKDYDELGKELSKLSNNCITLGHGHCDQKLSEYTEKAEELKVIMAEIESKIPEIQINLL